ncbi:hypothetical protein BDR26DRAFT_897914 [Obelidium mucronatum]|nr:hypothetical protein BDR26DRAFT_897914 [Obelidium mucronatum]
MFEAQSQQRLLDQHQQVTDNTCLSPNLISHVKSRVNQFAVASANTQRMAPTIPDDDYVFAVAIALFGSKIQGGTATSANDIRDKTTGTTTAELSVLLGVSFGNRMHADAAEYSDALAILNLFKAWVVECGGDEEDDEDRDRKRQNEWLLRTSVSGFAGRLGDVVKERMEVERMLGWRRRRYPVAATEAGTETCGSALFQGSQDAIRTVILAGCSLKIYHGVPREAELHGFDAANNDTGPNNEENTNE